ncbi:DUF5106 domain-containing protein [Sphingobacterium sp. SGG-5]|uniref:DUF5106 domain-containing protein n=1 Tax=Sphingobacterium sp. SGG-5 TaxID=2710881 RepID=UPI0013EA5F26|nr:DUF5106 domain-containing protein [Sphingobacterium sp. SGG-5]NGM61798.1 DUF5106 domain-containing protein [Sphingobacterium sp. SGG-5]
MSWDLSISGNGDKGRWGGWAFVGLLSVVLCWLVIGRQDRKDGREIISNTPSWTEGTFVNYISFLVQKDPSFAKESLDEMIVNVATDSLMLYNILTWSEKYFFNPNSPFRNEDFFEVLLQRALTTPVLDTLQRERYRKLLLLMQKNSIGEYATDFDFTLNNNKRFSLYNIEAEFLILFFGNPACPACKEMTDRIARSEIILNLLERKINGKPLLKVLHLYTDSNIALWYEHMAHFPSKWLNAHDKTRYIKTRELYDLKALPTLYLLDKNKKVLLKDVPFDVLEAYLLQFLNFQ